VQRADGSWLFDGLIPVPELKDRLALKELPEEDRGRYNTLAGMIMLLLGRLPRTTDSVEWEAGASRSSTSTASASTRCWTRCGCW
jgi:putative hemolysin